MLWHGDIGTLAAQADQTDDLTIPFLPRRLGMTQKTTSAFCIYFVLVVVLALVHIEEEDDDEQEETPKLFLPRRLAGLNVW